MYVIHIAAIVFVSLLAAGVVGFGLWLRPYLQRIQEAKLQSLHDEKVRLEIMQTEGDAVEKQTQRFETALKKQPKKRKERTIRPVKKGDRKRAVSSK
jgi:hypothetical protein